MTLCHSVSQCYTVSLWNCVKQQWLAFIASQSGDSLHSNPIVETKRDGIMTRRWFGLLWTIVFKSQVKKYFWSITSWYIHQAIDVNVLRFLWRMMMAIMKVKVERMRVQDNLKTKISSLVQKKKNCHIFLNQKTTSNLMQYLMHLFFLRIFQIPFVYKCMYKCLDIVNFKSKDMSNSKYWCIWVHVQICHFS